MGALALDGQLRILMYMNQSRVGRGKKFGEDHPLQGGMGELGLGDDASGHEEVALHVSWLGAKAERRDDVRSCLRRDQLDCYGLHGFETAPDDSHHARLLSHHFS